MKKDIQIPEVKQVYMAVIQEYSASFQSKDWYVYLINDKQVKLDMVLIVSKGADREKELKTSVMRRKINVLPAKSFAKIEFIHEDLLSLTNIFQVSFFEDGVLFDKEFVFEKDSISESAAAKIPLLNKKGVLAS